MIKYRNFDSKLYNYIDKVDVKKLKEVGITSIKMLSSIPFYVLVDEFHYSGEKAESILH